MMRTAKRLFAFLCTLALLISLCHVSLAAQADDTVWLDGQYHSPGSTEPRVWQFPYRDSLFDGADTQYNHTLAQASLGMALSAFRSSKREPSTQDSVVRAYLTQAGFTDISSEDYDKTPTIDTVSTLMAKKEINGSTVVAVAVCGGGYKDEWLSNFTIGNEQRHVGFANAAAKVEVRIRDYLQVQGISGNAKLWISGYSRAAAISNLTAADMTKSGLFDAVYAYTFATPRVTKAPEAYQNIFNIVGKFDPVPCVPLGDWGYERNGVDLHTPAQETDSDYLAKKAAADAVCRKLTGSAFFNLTDINQTLRTVLDYLLDILPTNVAYVEHMQPMLISLWQNHSVGNLTADITKMMNDEKLLTDDNRQELSSLLDYLSLIAYSTMEEEVEGGTDTWNNQTTMADNVAHEHSPDVYLSWLFSAEDASALFTTANSYTVLTWSGTATASVFDGQSRFLFSVDGHGRVNYSASRDDWQASAQPLSDRPHIACARHGTQTALTLPRDQNFTIVFEATAEETMMYFGAEYDVNTIRASLDEVHFIDTKAGQSYTITSLTDEAAGDGAHLVGAETFALSPWDADNPFTPLVLTDMEDNNAFHLTFTQMALIALGAVLLLLIVLTWLTVHTVRKHRKKKREA